MNINTFRGEIRLIAVLIGCALFIEFIGLDYFLAKKLYLLEGGEWSLRNNFWTKEILHEQIKNIIVLLYLAGWLFFFYIKGKNSTQDKFLLLAFINVLLIAIVIGALKTTSNVSCPWSIADFGGQYEYYGITRSFFIDEDLGNCFPGGHVTNAYAFLGFYFYVKLFYKEYSKPLLALILIIGLVLDITQQLRGAHFFSHGIWSMIIALSISYLSFGSLQKYLLIKNKLLTQ